MKRTLLILLILTVSKTYSQDTLKTKEIDLIVKNINQSNLATELDTIILDKPELGLKMITYLTMVVSDNQLKKYKNFVNTTMIQNGATKKMTTSTTFYYDKNKLIKVEEYMIESENKIIMDWYYSEDKSLYYTLQSENSEERAQFLLTLSETMLKQIIK